MNPKLSQESFCWIPVILVLSQIQGCICQADSLYETCRQPFGCANHGDIKYPFYGNDRPVSCGYPGFELDCQTDVPLITIESISYRILEINNSTYSLRVARNDLWGNNCPESLRNTTLDFNLFNFSSISNDQNITLNYGCNIIGPPPPPQQQFQAYNNFSCGSYPWNVVWTTEQAVLFGSTIRCSSNIFVPVNQTAASVLATPPMPIDVLRDALQSGFWIQWSANDSNCQTCEKSGGVCGSTQDSASFACYCSNGIYPLSCNNAENGKDSGSRSNNIGSKIGPPLGGAALAGIIVGWLVYRITRLLHSRRETGSETYQNIEDILLNQGSLAPKRYSYSEIKKITNSFSDKLGQGGYGSVYKGMLPKTDRRHVAVKLLTNTMSDGEEFINEVASISRTSHVNIVNLLGFCYEKKRRALVYEFMPNKSLDKFIYDNKSLSQLGWERMYKIAIGVARGLEYLHRGCNTRIVHFDIKPQNILLDEDFCPKISDFGLAKLCRKKQSILSMLGTRGTIGYIAPEVFSRNYGGVSHKSDVYSYGMMVLEMAGARNNVGVGSIQSSESYFPDKIYERITLHETKNLDGVEIAGDDVEIAGEEEITMKMLLVAFWCIQTVPSDRPSISKVVEMLEGSLEHIQIPPKPVLFTTQPLRQEITTSESRESETENSIEC